MKLFAALERALLARWRKIKVALKVNKWPLLSLKEQRLQLKKQYLESLFKKKWQKFERSIYDGYRSHFTPLSLAIIQTGWDSLDWWIQWVSAQQGRIWYTWDCINVSRSVGVPVSRQSQDVLVLDSQSCATQIGCVGLVKSYDSLRIIML